MIWNWQPIPNERQFRRTYSAREYVRTWLLSSDTLATDYHLGQEMESFGLVPPNTHPDDSGAYLIDAIGVDLGTGMQFNVTASYTSNPPAEVFQSLYPNNPILEPARVFWDSETYQEAATIDINGKLKLNSAGDPFDPPPMKDFNRRTAVVRKNVSMVPPWFLDYENAVNRDAFVLKGLPIPAGKAMCKRTTVSDANIRNGVVFYECTTVIHFSRVGWKSRLADVGFRKKYFDAITGTYKRSNILYQNSSGEYELPAAPVPLNGFGQPLANPDLTNGVFLEFDDYPLKPFGVLPLW